MNVCVQSAPKVPGVWTVPDSVCVSTPTLVIQYQAAVIVNQAGVVDAAAKVISLFL